MIVDCRSYKRFDAQEWQSLRKLNLLGFAGRVGIGKTTIAETLKARIPSFKIKSFASKIKTIARIFGIDDKDKHYEQFNMTGREFLQKLGTDCFRDIIDKDIWVKAMFRCYDTGYDRWIIDDVRFPNEVKAITDRGGVVIRFIDRYNEYASSPSTTHRSENALHSFDLPEIVATGDESEMATKVMNYSFNIGRNLFQAMTDD